MLPTGPETNSSPLKMGHHGHPKRKRSYSNHPFSGAVAVSFGEGTTFYQWIFQVPVKGGRDYITPQKAIYKWYISGIYCQLGDYMPPTTL